MNSLVLLVAQGFGIGRVRYAPGTWGSVLGLGWFWLLVSVTGRTTHNIWVLFSGMALGVIASIWLCGRAEKILGQKDPPSVVLDEVVAMPVCFIMWIPAGVRFDFTPIVLVVFVLFRIFDIWKPWPIKQIQNLPGGWGIVIDDLFAAAYVNVCAIIFALLLQKFSVQ
jgi:phosphatidylglycerophosphatase A